MIKSLIKRTPILGALVKRGRRALRSGRKPAAPPFVLERADWDQATDPAERERRQLLNLLNYTKTSGSSYSARVYPAGYHTIVINGVRFQGQRDPDARLAALPVDLRGKSVLDIGSNQGGMLLAADGIAWGVGIDYDSRMVNVANRLARARAAHNIGFYVFDLENEDLQIIKDLLPAPRVDIVFLLSVCMWLRNWQDVIEFAASVSESMLFETNGSNEQQNDQEAYLRRVYANLQTLATTSEDDPKQKRRKLLFCTGYIPRSSRRH